ncbi:UNVERIFIED_CONTAM: hypothetical protein O8I53_07915 [Campylobacter lari]
MNYISDKKDSIYYNSDTAFYNELVKADTHAKNSNLGIYSDGSDLLLQIYPKM